MIVGRRFEANGDTHSNKQLAVNSDDGTAIMPQVIVMTVVICRVIMVKMRYLDV